MNNFDFEDFDKIDEADEIDEIDEVAEDEPEGDGLEIDYNETLTQMVSRYMPKPSDISQLIKDRGVSNKEGLTPWAVQQALRIAITQIGEQIIKNEIPVERR